MVKEIGGYKYYVEVYDGEKKKWVAEVRNYLVEQDVSKFPDNKSRRNFKFLSHED